MRLPPLALRRRSFCALAVAMAPLACTAMRRSPTADTSTWRSGPVTVSSAAPPTPFVTKDATDHGDAVQASEVFVIEAPATTVLRALDNPLAYRHIFPRVLSARDVGKTDRGERLVTIEQGTPLFRAHYTVRVRRDGDASVYLWLDPEFDHDIRNAQGFFLVEPVGPRTTRLTLHVLVDLGSEPWKALFHDKVKAAFRATPRMMARYLESQVNEQRDAAGLSPTTSPSPPLPALSATSWQRTPLPE